MQQKTYTWSEVGKHNKQNDLWLVIDESVYNVTNYSGEHPGGPIVFQNKAGRNATMAFDQAGHSTHAKNDKMPQFKIGKIIKDSPMEQWQKQPKSTSPNILVTATIVVVILGLLYFISS